MAILSESKRCLTKRGLASNFAVTVRVDQRIKLLVFGKYKLNSLSFHCVKQ
jgi:hypothetical protein